MKLNKKLLSIHLVSALFDLELFTFHSQSLLNFNS